MANFTKAQLEQKVAELEAKLEDKRQRGESVPEPAADVLHDPFYSRNPHSIKSHPEGFRLGWKNPTYRERRGWRGWEAITWDSPEAEKLSEYLNDPPRRMEGMQQQDNYVRRGDAILCKLPLEIWQARQAKRTYDANRKLERARATENKIIREGVTTFGDGMTMRDSAQDNGPPATPGEHRTKLFRD